MGVSTVFSLTKILEREGRAAAVVSGNSNRPCFMLHPGSSSAAVLQAARGIAPPLTVRTEVRLDDLVPQALVVPLPVVVLAELGGRSTQRSLTNQDHPLQTLRLDRSHKPLRECVQIGRAWRQAHRLHAGTFEDRQELFCEQRRPVMDQVSAPAEEAVHAVGEISPDLLHPLARPARGRSRRCSPSGSRAGSRTARGSAPARAASTPRR